MITMRTVSFLQSLLIGPVLFFASAAGITDAGAGAGAGAGTGGAAGGGGTGTGAGAGAGGGAAAAPTIDWSTAPQHLRTAYETAKRERDDLQKQYEPWQRLGMKPEDVSSSNQGYQQVYSEIKGVSDQLDIPENEIADAIRQFGVLRVLDHLRGELYEAEQANAGDEGVLREQDLDARIQAGIEAAVSPIQNRENQRLVHEANALSDRVINEMAADMYKKQGVDYASAPNELKMFISTGVTEVLKYDDEALHALKYEGRTVGIQKAFQTFMQMWDAAYLARRKMEGNVVPQQRGGGRSPAGGPPADGKKPPSLDEIIADPNLVRTSQGKPAYST